MFFYFFKKALLKSNIHLTDLIIINNFHKIISFRDITHLFLVLFLL